MTSMITLTLEIKRIVIMMKLAITKKNFKPQELANFTINIPVSALMRFQLSHDFCLSI